MQSNGVSILVAVIAFLLNACGTLEVRLEQTPPAPTDTVGPTPSNSLAPATTRPDLAILRMYLEMEGRHGDCVAAYAPYGIRVVIGNVGNAPSGPFMVDLDGTRQRVEAGLAVGQSIELHFGGTTPSGLYTARVVSDQAMLEAHEGNNIQTYTAPTPTAPPLCTAVEPTLVPTISEPTATPAVVPLTPPETRATQPVQLTPADEPAAATLDQTPAASGGDGTAAEIHQWATGANATSQLDEAHSAAEAAGDPAVEGCDFSGHNFKLRPNAWASAGENTTETLTLDYATPVIPTEITIHQVLIPNAVTEVDVVDVTGAVHVVYTGSPYDLDVCPYLMQIDVLDVTAKVDTVVITVDQSVMSKRNEINAVELVGQP